MVEGIRTWRGWFKRVFGDLLRGNSAIFEVLKRYLRQLVVRTAWRGVGVWMSVRGRVRLVEEGCDNMCRRDVK